MHFDGVEVIINSTNVNKCYSLAYRGNIFKKKHHISNYFGNTEKYKI